MVDEDATESWHEARLIPTSGISGADEQERRATSALLAVMSIVKEFGLTLLKPLGAPAGNFETYIEVPFDTGDRKIYPDGLIRVSRGKATWTALVEVKTGKNELAAEQLEAYLDLAREHRFDALLTISNEIPPMFGVHPTKVDGRKLRKVDLHHRSWSYVLSTAVMQAEHKGISDPEQAWILRELIRYLEHPRSGAMEFSDMGQHWVTLRNAVRTQTLRATDPSVPDVVARFDALIRFACLRLGRQLGTEIVPGLSRKERADPQIRTQDLTRSLTEAGQLTGAVKIPATVGSVHLTADLRASQITAHISIDAPRTGRQATRVNWLVRQLKNAPGDTRIEALVANSRGPGAAELLSVVRDDPSVLVIDPKKEIRSFRIAYSAPMGTKVARGRGSFIDSVLDLLDTFYADVVQHLKSWSAPPPRLREAESEPEPALSSTALSSQDGAVAER
ncbi:hypothetical protein [Ruania alkalisoli]|nr:hypothetical protein [Ruania alkalisoli]